jgi:hypothetical protein
MLHHAWLLQAQRRERSGMRRYFQMFLDHIKAAFVPELRGKLDIALEAK